MDRRKSRVAGVAREIKENNMSGYGYKEARIDQERRPRAYYCGECGVEVRSNELLCDDCARSDATRWEPVEIAQ